MSGPTTGEPSANSNHVTIPTQRLSVFMLLLGYGPVVAVVPAVSSSRPRVIIRSAGTQSIGWNDGLGRQKPTKMADNYKGVSSESSSYPMPICGCFSG